MSTTQAITIEQFWEEYADSDQGRYEYDHGRLIELPMPDWLHGRIVQEICYLLRLHYPDYWASPEVDSKVSSEEVRRPDIAVQHKGLIREPYPTPERPLYLAVEILSRGGMVGPRHSLPKTFTEAVSKYVTSYAPWGVPYCWILDPHTCTAWHNANEFREPVAELLAGEIRLACEEIFQALDNVPENLR